MPLKFMKNGFPMPSDSEIFDTSKDQTYRKGTGSLPQVFPARIFPMLAKALGWKVSAAGYGLNVSASLMKYDLNTQSWKTSERSLVGDLIEFSGAFPKSGMMRNGRIYGLPMSERPTKGKEYGLWATPAAADAVGSHGGGQGRCQRTDIHKWKKEQEWPTPQARDYRSGDNPGGTRAQRKEKQGWSQNLNDAVLMFPTPTSSMMSIQDMEQARFAGSDKRRPKYREIWPTPLASDGEKGSPNASRGLVPAVFHTPTLNDARKSLTESQINRKSLTGDMVRSGVTGQLNPMWVEWLMGYPLGWTDLKDSETLSSLKL